MNGETAIDLDGYLVRVCFAGDVEPVSSTLVALHRAHLANIPFENLDVCLGRPVRLDLETLQSKLVRDRRGGYCFEHNTLFAAVLRALGFEVATLEARVRPPGASAPLPRTHMLLRVEVEGRPWLADVGFGGDGPLLPVPFDGEPSQQADGAFRVERETAGTLLLRRFFRGSWSDLYAFSPIPALPVDFEVANHFTATHPGSIFRKTLTVQRSTPEVRHILRGLSYVRRQGEEELRREVTVDEVQPLLADRFGLEVPVQDVREALAARA